MNVKLAVVLALACLFLAGVCFAKDNNECDNDKEFDVTDKVYKNGRVVVTWGKHGGKVRVHSLFAPRKWVQIAHVRVQELTKNRAPVYLKNSKGKVTNKLRAINLANTDFTWSTPTIADGGEGRTVDAYLRTQFSVVAGGVLTKVVFRVNVVQENSLQVLNGVTLRREVDDVQFSLDIVDWPFESDSNLLDWSFYVKTNYDAADKKADGTLTKSKILRVNGVPGTGAFVFKNAILNYPNNAQVDGVLKPCVSEVTDIDNKGDYSLDVYFPKAAHHLFYNAIMKMINLPPGSGDPGPQNPPCPTGQTCTPPCSPTNPCPPADPCTPNPCKNGGACANVAGVPSCTCTGSYTGATCESNACATNPCEHGGTCFGTGPSCHCADGFSGPTCHDVVPCFNNPCQNGGACNPADGSCACVGNYGGTTCQTDLCLNKNCGTHGSCVKGACSCTGGWGSSVPGGICDVAPNCDVSVDPCQQPNSSPCHGHGTCTCNPADNTATCACDVGWKVAPDCSVGACQAANAPQCEHGTCHANGDTPQCVCDAGFSGTTCQTAIDPCASVTCQNSGACHPDTNGAAKCDCPIGFSGDFCEHDVCASAPCHHGGQCNRLGADAFSCTCTGGWVGGTNDPFCDTPTPINLFMGVPADTALTVDAEYYTNGPPDAGSSTFGIFTTGDNSALLVLYPAFAAMRLYDLGGEELSNVRERLKSNHFYTSGVELDQTVGEFMGSADFIQLSHAALVETDATPNHFELSGKTFDLNGGTWQYEQTLSTADVKKFIYYVNHVSETGSTVFVEVHCDFYSAAARANVIVPDQPDGVFIDLGAGALKFTFKVGPWPWSDTDDGTGSFAQPYLKWISWIQTRNDILAFNEQALETGEKRFAVTQGTYDAHPSACQADGGGPCSGPVLVHQEFDGTVGATKVVHYLPFYYDNIQFDPVLQLPKPGEPEYPPWVDPETPGGASVIRDPRSQFGGAATLHTSAVAVVFAAAAAFLSARL